MNIVLTGFMGTGKTAVGKMVANKLGWQFFDTDEIIEEEIGMKISGIFANKGEPYFRELETKTVRLLALLDKAVISCGGGVVLRAENMDELEKKGYVVCLTASPEVILERTRGETRPLLKVKNPLQKIREMLQIREPYYKRCKLMIDTSSVSIEQAAGMIMKEVAEQQGRQ
jgi:shikimate kinase